MSTTAQRSCSDPPPFALSEKDVVELAHDLCAYHQHFAGLFFRKEQRHWALKYLEGLLLPSQDKCIERVALSVEDGKVRPMQRFVGEGAWDDEQILDKHAELVAESLGEAGGVLIADGSEFPKKGKYSAGVARQWCGIRGKIDNCQAGVFLSYASARGYVLVDRRLYLPEEWFQASARERWQRCRIPDETPFRTKPQLAWEMIEQLNRRGVLPFTWVTCDEVFGNNPEFLERLERAEMRYLADVPVSTQVWLERPETEMPPSKGRGRPLSRERVAPGAPQPIRVDELAAQLPRRAWRKHLVKDGEKGFIEARFAFVRAVAVRDKLPGPELWVVFRRSLGASPELKVFISNAPADALRRELVRVSAMRWPIETCFEEAKGELGMAEYQTRSWRGWHHHMTLVILAHHFVVGLKLKHKKGHRRLRSRKPASC
jgi:SRSO17 transposase